MLKKHAPVIEAEMVRQYGMLPEEFRVAAGDYGETHWLHITGNARRKLKKAMMQSPDALSLAAVARQFVATPKSTSLVRAAPQPVPVSMADPCTLLAKVADHQKENDE